MKVRDDFRKILADAAQNAADSMNVNAMAAKMEDAIPPERRALVDELISSAVETLQGDDDNLFVRLADASRKIVMAFAVATNRLPSEIYATSYQAARIYEVALALDAEDEARDRAQRN